VEKKKYCVKQKKTKRTTPPLPLVKKNMRASFNAVPVFTFSERQNPPFDAALAATAAAGAATAAAGAAAGAALEKKRRRNNNTSITSTKVLQEMERAEANKKRKFKFASCDASKDIRCLSEVCLVERSRKPPHQRLSEEEWLCVMSFCDFGRQCDEQGWCLDKFFKRTIIAALNMKKEFCLGGGPFQRKTLVKTMDLLNSWNGKRGFGTKEKPFVVKLQGDVLSFTPPLLGQEDTGLNIRPRGSIWDSIPSNTKIIGTKNTRIIGGFRLQDKTNISFEHVHFEPSGFNQDFHFQNCQVDLLDCSFKNFGSIPITTLLAGYPFLITL
jgi:hypothetical protein